MRFIFLLLFTVFTFNASSQACGPEVASDHCPTVQEVTDSDCHSSDADSSESDHDGQCGCGCHMGSRTTLIFTEPVLVSNNSLIRTKDLIKLIYLLEPQDFKDKINRPPIYLS